MIAEKFRRDFMVMILEDAQQPYPSINGVCLGDYVLVPLYPSPGYFDPKTGVLGIEAAGSRSKSPKTIVKNSFSKGVDRLYVCEYCFKYTTDSESILRHRILCAYNTELPHIGELVYRDDDTPYIIRKVNGYAHSLFCQNLCLFSKMFLVDKSVFYNVSQFDFYVVYGFDSHELLDEHLRLPNLKPMGFFSKELVSWEGDNNLACICVFPPYQRRHLGSLLIEFLYALARVTPGQYLSGPEFPLSPFGKVAYLHFWSRNLAGILLHSFGGAKSLTLAEIADITGYRKDDIMLTLQYMKVVQNDKNNRLCLYLENVRRWCAQHNIDPDQEYSMLKQECVLL